MQSRLANGIHARRGASAAHQTQARLPAAALHPESKKGLSTLWITLINA